MNNTPGGLCHGATEVELVWMVLSQRVHPSGEVYYQVRARANIGGVWEVEEWRRLSDGTWRLKRWLGPSGAPSHDEISVSGPGP